MDTCHNLVVGSMRLSTVAIVDIVEHRVTTLNDGGVGSHRSCQIRILFPVSIRHLNPLSKIDLTATILFHAKLPEFGDGASKKYVLRKLIELTGYKALQTLIGAEIHCHKQLYRTKKPVKSEGLAFKKRVIFLSELVKRVLSLLGLLC
nr:hypothetical protein CFP56_34487 [Quercus suber]